MIKVLHLMTASEKNRGVGGAETLLLSITEKMSKEDIGFIIAYTSGGMLTDDFKKAGAEVVQFDTASQIDLPAVFKLVKLIKSRNIDIVHSHQLRYDFLGSIAARISKTPFIFTRHQSLSDYPIKRFKKAIFLNVDRLITVRSADKIAAVSKFIAADLIRNEWVPAERIEVIYSGLDLKKYNKEVRVGNIRKEFSIDPRAPLIGTVGRINIEKAHDLFLKAAAEVIKAAPDARFIIAGDGPLRENQEKLSEELGLKSKVIFTGYRRDIPEIIADLNIFALSSLTESLGIVNLEAMAMGKPVVSFDVGGVSELVADKETGLLVPPRDAVTFAGAIIGLIRDKGKAKNMGLAGRRRVEENFTLDATVKKYHELYNSIAEGGQKQ
ncbi:MAG: glycosyltransferase [Candidatus Omnitrophica bacterium]|nr:glycosyltransferase [Candidatus Omnitrophota bacterium]